MAKFFRPILAAFMVMTFPVFPFAAGGEAVKKALDEKGVPYSVGRFFPWAGDGEAESVIVRVDAAAGEAGDGVFALVCPPDGPQFAVDTLMAFIDKAKGSSGGGLYAVFLDQREADSMDGGGFPWADSVLESADGAAVWYADMAAAPSELVFSWDTNRPPPLAMLEGLPRLCEQLGVPFAFQAAAGAGAVCEGLSKAGFDVLRVSAGHAAGTVRAETLGALAAAAAAHTGEDGAASPRRYTVRKLGDGYVFLTEGMIAAAFLVFLALELFWLLFFWRVPNGRPLLRGIGIALPLVLAALDGWLCYTCWQDILALPSLLPLSAAILAAAAITHTALRRTAATNRP